MAPWLGLIINLVAKMLAFTEEHREQALRALSNCLDSQSSSPRAVLSAAGQINSLSLTLGLKALSGTKIFY